MIEVREQSSAASGGMSMGTLRNTLGRWYDISQQECFIFLLNEKKRIIPTIALPAHPLKHFELAVSFLPSVYKLQLVHKRTESCNKVADYYDCCAYSQMRDVTALKEGLSRDDLQPSTQLCHKFHGS